MFIGNSAIFYPLPSRFCLIITVLWKIGEKQNEIFVLNLLLRTPLNRYPLHYLFQLNAQASSKLLGYYKSKSLGRINFPQKIWGIKSYKAAKYPPEFALHKFGWWSCHRRRRERICDSGPLRECQSILAVVSYLITTN